MKVEEFIQEKVELTKSWLQKTLLKSKISVAALADSMGFRSDSSLYKAANPNEINHRLHLDNLPILIHETGDFFILDQIESLFNRVAFQLPKVSPDLACINRESATTIKEFGELMLEVARAVEDNRITRDELERVEKEGQEAIRQIAGLLEAVRQMHHSKRIPSPAGVCPARP